MRHIEQALALLRQRPPSAHHTDLTTQDRIRVEKLGLVAVRHLEFIEEHGSMTLGDSLAIRRELYPDKKTRRATANLFGKNGKGGILQRTTPHKKRPADGDPVVLTPDGQRIAGLYRERYGALL